MQYGHLCQPTYHLGLHVLFKCQHPLPRTQSNSDFVRRVKLRLAYRLAFVKSQNCFTEPTQELGSVFPWDFKQVCWAQQILHTFLFFASFCHASPYLLLQTLQPPSLRGSVPASWRQNGKQWWPQRSWNHCSHPVAKWHESSALKKKLTVICILPKNNQKIWFCTKNLTFVCSHQLFSMFSNQAGGKNAPKNKTPAPPLVLPPYYDATDAPWIRPLGA